MQTSFLKSVIQAGWPATQDEVPDCTLEYFSFRDELSVQDGLVFRRELGDPIEFERGVQAETASESSWNTELTLRTNTFQFVLTNTLTALRWTAFLTRKARR